MSPDKPDLATSIQQDLIPVNAVIGFLKRDKRWPSPLYELGYRLAMIEQPVSAGSVGIAEIDVICLSRRRNHGMLWECKSGRTIEEKQARVYAAVSPEDVQRTGNVTFPHPVSASVEAVYCCLESDSKGIVRALKEWGLSIPVISLGERALLVSGRFIDDDATMQFTEGIALPRLEEVPRFLIANTHTPKWRLAGAIFATMVSFLRKQTGKFSVRHILEETFPDWECMGTDLRRNLNSVAKEIARDLCQNELKDYARIGKASTSPGETLIEFTVDVLGQDASKRTRTFQKLLELAYEYVERTREDRPYEATQRVDTPWLPGLEPE